MDVVKALYNATFPTSVTPTPAQIHRTSLDFEEGGAPALLLEPSKLGCKAAKAGALEQSLVLGDSVSLAFDKTPLADTSTAASALQTLNRALTLGVVAGSQPVSARLQRLGNPAQNTYGRVSDNRGNEIHIYFGLTEKLRFESAIIEYSASLPGPALIHWFQRVMTAADERCRVANLYFATACMDSLDAINPSSMGSPPMLLCKNQADKGQTAAPNPPASPARKRGSDAFVGIPPPSGQRRHPGCCNEYQATGRCTKGDCRFDHRCDLCRSPAHGSRICTVGFRP